MQRKGAVLSSHSTFTSGKIFADIMLSEEHRALWQLFFIQCFSGYLGICPVGDSHGLVEMDEPKSPSSIRLRFYH